MKTRNPKPEIRNPKKIPYHLIDIVSPKKQFTLADYQKRAYAAIDDIIERGKTPFLVGGTGLYLSSIIDGYQLTNAKPDIKLRQSLNKKTLLELQKMARKYRIKLNQSDFYNKRRLVRVIEKKRLQETTNNFQTNSKFQNSNTKYNCLILGIKYPKKIIDKRIDKRLIYRLEKEKMIDEVKKLRKNGVSWQRLNDFGLEYRFIAKYLQNEISYDELVKLLSTAIHQFAKRQLTWFKRMSRISWINREIEAERLIKKFLWL